MLRKIKKFVKRVLSRGRLQHKIKKYDKLLNEIWESNLKLLRINFLILQKIGYPTNEKEEELLEETIKKYYQTIGEMNEAVDQYKGYLKEGDS